MEKGYKALEKLNSIYCKWMVLVYNTIDVFIYKYKVLSLLEKNSWSLFTEKLHYILQEFGVYSQNLLVYSKKKLLHIIEQVY